jgi:type II secretory pathway component PulK
MMSRHRVRGAALLLVLWAITVISFAVLWMADVVNLELETTISDSAGLRARQIAVSGVALGLHPQVEREDTGLLNQDFGEGERMEVRIRGEGARFNINQLLKEQDRITMVNLFTLWGLNADEANALIDKLTDWIDEDDFRTGFNGAEGPEYEALGITDAPANRPFRSVQEMGRVLDMEKLAAVKPDWAESFTIFGDGKIDVNEAEADVLQAATGSTPEMVQGILQQRRGDGAAGAERREDQKVGRQRPRPDERGDPRLSPVLFYFIFSCCCARRRRLLTPVDVWCRPRGDRLRTHPARSSYRRRLIVSV